MPHRLAILYCDMLLHGVEYKSCAGHSIYDGEYKQLVGYCEEVLRHGGHACVGYV